MKQCIIAVPCYNEAQRLDVPAFARFAAACPECSFVMVDDGSRDGTLELLEGLARDNPGQFSVCRLPRNSGKGEAVRRGVLEALVRRVPKWSVIGMPTWPRRWRRFPSCAKS